MMMNTTTQVKIGFKPLREGRLDGVTELKRRETVRTVMRAVTAWFYTRCEEEARAARAPRPPEELVGALQDRIHPTSGRLRAAKSVRFRGGR